MSFEPERSYPGYFITFEGGEGSGKSTLVERFVGELRQLGLNIVWTREPGGSPTIGRELREMLLSLNGKPLTPWAEALLFAAERAQHVDELIMPALRDGAIVVCDRYIDSSIAYQGAGRGLGYAEIRQVSVWGTGNLMPDWTVMLDVSPEIGLSRRHAHGGVDRMDSEDLAFHAKVRDALRFIAISEPERVTVVDASPAFNDVYDAVWSEWVLRSMRLQH